MGKEEGWELAFYKNYRALKATIVKGICPMSMVDELLDE